MALVELDFIDRAEVIHLLGLPSTGKLHVATALGIAAVKARKIVYYSTLSTGIEMMAKGSAFYRRFWVS